MSYCSYKEYVRWWSTSSLPAGLKWEIKSAFPSAIAISVSLYLISRALRPGSAPGPGAYALMLCAYAAILSALAFTYSAESVLVNMGSAAFMAALFVAAGKLRQAAERLPAALAWLEKGLSGAEGMSAWLRGLAQEAAAAASRLRAGARASRLIAAGTAALLASVLLAAAGQRAAAGHAASLAYFLLLAGVATKFVGSVRGSGQGKG